MVKDPPANARDVGLISGWGRPPGGRHGNPPQCSCLGNPMDQEPGGLRSLGLQRVGHDWSNLACTCLCVSLSQILFPLRFLQDSERSSLCFTVGPCWLFMLNIVMCIYQSQTPKLSFPHFSPLLTISSWVCFCFVDKFLSITFYRIHI